MRSTLPAVVFLAAVFVVPLLLLLPLSVLGPDGVAGNYLNLLESPVFLKVMANTFLVAAWVTAIGLLIGFTVAWALCVVNPTAGKIMLGVVVMSMWSSLLARTYSWLILLQDSGPVNHILEWLNIIDEPLNLVGNDIGVVIGMVYIMLPFIILPVYGAIRRMDGSVLNAAAICGAGRFVIFWRVFVPMLRAPVAAAVLMVFVMSLGYYVTPALLGSPSDMMLAQLIAEKVQNELDWQYATASAVILLTLTLILYWGIYVRASGDMDAK